MPASRPSTLLLPLRYLGAFVVGIPVFVFKSYFQSKLSLEWRQWMTQTLLQDYFSDRTFYQLQAGASRGGPDSVDNPDQRISSDVTAFTETAMSLSLTLLNALVDLVSFSGILFSIYPPLFIALVTYSIGGTAASVALGKVRMIADAWIVTVLFPPMSQLLQDLSEWGQADTAC